VTGNAHQARLASGFDFAKSHATSMRFEPTVSSPHHQTKEKGLPRGGPFFFGGSDRVIRFQLFVQRKHHGFLPKRRIANEPAVSSPQQLTQKQKRPRT
jgi:hypothetical protein